MDIIFIPFSLEPGLHESRPDLPLGALARQVPQILCSLAHGQDGIRARFFPFVSSEDGQRGFTSFGDLLPPEQILGQILKAIEPAPALVIDGHISASETSLRSLRLSSEGPEIADLLSFPTPLEDPRVLLNRLALELWDFLDLSTRVRAPSSLGREALWLYLEGKDRELALKAGLQSQDQDPFAPFIQALALEPRSGDLQDALLDLALVCIEEGRADPLLAAAALTRTAQEGEVDTPWLVKAFRLAQQSGHNEAALQLGQSLLARRPDQFDLALGLARFLAGRQRYSEARDLLHASLPTASASASASTSASPADQTTDMSTIEAKKTRSEMVALLFQLSSTLSDDAACDRWMEELLQHDPIPKVMLPFAAHWLMDQGRHDAAQLLLDEALSGQPQAPELALEQGRLLMLRGADDEARTWLERAKSGEEPVREEAERLQRVSGSPPVLALLQEIENMNRGGKAQEALALARRVVKVRPDLAESWYALGLVRSTLGQARRAIRALRRALNCKQDYKAARNRLGILLVSTGRYQDGYCELSQVLKEEEDIMSPLLHMTQACYYLKRHHEAVQHLERAEELFPDHPAVRQTRTTFYPIS